MNWCHAEVVDVAIAIVCMIQRLGLGYLSYWVLWIGRVKRDTNSRERCRSRVVILWELGPDSLGVRHVRHRIR